MMEENQALLYKEQGKFQRNFSKVGGGSLRSSSEGSNEWWEDSHSSCSSCCNSNSETSFEWEAEVNENGQLFYIECNIPGDFDGVDSYEYEKPEEECDDKPGKVESVKGGQLANWIRRKDIKKMQLMQKQESNQSHHQELQLKIQDKAQTPEEKTELKDVTITINKVYEGSTLCEKLLGLTLESLSTNKISIINICSNGPTQNCKDLAVGDILYKINNYTVTPQNLDTVLSTLNFPTEVVLRIQKKGPVEKFRNYKYQSNFVKSLLNKNEAIETILTEQPVGVVVVDMESQNLNKDDVIYHYPEKCVLSSCRGAFVTLFHLLAEIASNDECQSSSIVMKKQPAHILYRSENNFLLLVAIPKQKCTIKEATYIVDDLIKNLLFNHQTLKRCFEESKTSDLDQFFSVFFSRILTNGFSHDASGFVCTENLLSSSLKMGPPQFEDILPHAKWVPLPKEAQIQIDDALNELESNDIEHEEEHILMNQRLFTIIGSCLFHKGYLLVSHLPKEDLLDVYSFYRQNSLIQLFCNEPVKSLVIWREVYPSSVSRGLPSKKNASFPVPTGKWFLLIVGQGYDSLAVILEAGICCAKVDENAGPAVVYVEEAKDTLRHIQKLGITNLASRWINNDNRFKTITPEEMFTQKANKKKENLLGFVKSFDGNSKSPGLNLSSGSSKSSDTNSTKKTRGSQQEASEDSVSQTPSNVSEISDENAPILGRRAERGKTYIEQASDSDSSSSDWDSSRDSNMLESTCSSGVDNLYLGDIGEVIPSKLTTGSYNLLFSYIHLDGNEGVLLNAPLNSKKSTPKMMEIVENFRRCAQIIHSILENNIMFKKSSQDNSKAFINKSLIAVKEHGVLFECLASDFDSHKKPSSLPYWIVGRLFFAPQPREVYVCYYDDAPQNLVEIAFRLGLSSSG